jgi:hypothetical protein
MERAALFDLGKQRAEVLLFVGPSLTRAESNTFIAEYVAGLEGYTYLEGEAAR